MNTPKHTIIAIAAIGRTTRALGNKGKLIWHLPNDLTHFHTTTTGHPIIMGATTYYTLPPHGRPLPGRTNIVMTTDPAITDIEGAIVVHSPEEALKVARQSPGNENIFIGGGGIIYKVMLPYTDILNLTLIDDTTQNVTADAFFPEYPEFTKILSERPHEENGVRYAFTLLARPDPKS